MLEKFAFWKKPSIHVPHIDNPNTAQGPVQPKSYDFNHPESFAQQSPSSQDPFAAQQPTQQDPFTQNQDPFAQPQDPLTRSTEFPHIKEGPHEQDVQNQQEPTRDMELILTKLDSIRLAIENMSHRMDKIEHRIDNEERKSRSW